MPLPLWFPMAVQGGKALGSFVTGLLNRPKPFRDTPRGKYLQKIRKEGVISPLEKRQILGGVVRTSGGIGGRRRESYLGRLQSLGAGGSIAGEEAVADIGSEFQQQLGETGTKVDIANVQSKRAAEEAYATGATEYGEAERQRKQQMVENLLGGLGGAATELTQQGQGAVGDIINKYSGMEPTPENLQAAKMEMINLNIDPDQIEKYLQLMGMGG